MTVRGNAQQDIFQDDKDRYMLYGRLAQSVSAYAVRIYLFCLMDNHFHLVLETPGANLDKFMQSVLTGYTVCYNLHHDRHGHLTQGRYGARLVSGDNYLLKLSRYVHLNPVHVKDYSHRPIADQIEHLRSYKWSSYLGYIEQAKHLDWVEYTPLLALAGGRRKERSERYRCFVEAGLTTNDEELEEAMRLSHLSVGDDKFREWVDEHYAELLRKRKHPEDVALRQSIMSRPDPASVLHAVAAVAGTTPEGLKARSRHEIWKGIAAKLLVTHAGITRRECAHWLGLSYGSSVGYQIKLANINLISNTKIARKVAHLESQWKIT